tara:strand:- start:9261 stop:9551 length:291 start_codon:yes stop_codon:yes gene_type:complete
MTTESKYTGLTFARQCDECKQGMNEGYVICNGEQYYCTDECLHKHFTHEQWYELHENGDGESYYSAWEEDEHEYKQMPDGTLEEIERPDENIEEIE